ncbi:chaplin [Streptomyces sp. NPDC002888]|uniref:chaplin n=1 Tax=Streptomyces sp. NPDC002888 TaxID=3364668 RepID=UPI0036A792A4
MRQTLSGGVFAAAAATGILSLYCSPALADTDATAVAKDSPGVVSGNIVQVPIEAPANVCGNTVGVIAAFNHATDNSCDNTSYGDDHEEGDYGYGEDTPPSASPTPPPPSKATPPPTRISETHRPTPPPTRSVETPPERPVEPPHLAETGSGALWAASAASAALIAGGAMMYRRGRAGA